MRLLIDSGNTRTKYAISNHGHWLEEGIVDDFKSLKKKLSIKYPNLNHAIFADVSGALSKENLQAFFPKLEVHSVKALTMPFQSAYTTPETLGDDRLAVVAAAMKKYPKQNCVLIDAGSCITFDVLTAEGQYLGGSISPGLQMRFKALHSFTGKLPHCSAPAHQLALGTSTQESIQTGVVNGVKFEIEGQINALEQKFPSLTVILTGGDAVYLSKTVKNTIFAEPNFLAEGLDYILEYNNY